MLIGGGVAAFLLLGGDDDPTTTATTDSSSEVAGGATPPEPPNTPEDTGGGGSGDVPEPGSPPDGLGDDPVLDALAQDCFDGDLQACDDLFLDSPVDSDYETYGNTCGDRVPEDEVNGRLCTIIFP